MTSPGPLQALLARGVLLPIDVAFARAVQRAMPSSSPLVLLSAALASHAVQQGHLCLDLARTCEEGLRDSDGAPVPWPLPELPRWHEQLVASEAVGGDGARPLLLDAAGRLYLARYADYQQRLAHQLLRRSQRRFEPEVDAVAQRLKQLFGSDGAAPLDAQKLAAAVALCRGLCVISGGPGTGKTTTVAKLLTLLQERALASGRPLQVLALAPTGKAAQRLGEALETGVRNLDVDARVKERLPTRAFTIHHALGFQPRTPTRFRYGAGRPLSADVVLVDEASMVDVALMTKLVEATAPHARLILLGDRDQLASVDAGAVFGDIIAAATGMSRKFSEQLSHLCGQDWRVKATDQPTPLGDCVVSLTRSYRYAESSGIGALARAINAGAADAALALLGGDGGKHYDDVALTPLSYGPGGHAMSGVLGRLARDGFRDYLQRADPAERLALFNRFRILSLHRRGGLGVEQLNLDVERMLDAAGWIRCRQIFYDKRPLMVTENDYQLGLFNGDVGVVKGGGVSGCYFGERAGVRKVATARLPSHETVYAMTVHKSQGSEFRRVALVLPHKPSPLLTRELLYTAVSRARERVDIVGSEAVLRAGIARRVARRSGLVDALRAGDGGEDVA